MMIPAGSLAQDVVGSSWVGFSHYLEEKLSIQPQVYSEFGMTSQLALSSESPQFSHSHVLHTYNKMDKVFCEVDLTPIRHKGFNEFMKGKGFKGRNDHKLRDLKAMFGFKPVVTGSPVTLGHLEP